jgi:hypothetical protein
LAAKFDGTSEECEQRKIANRKKQTDGAVVVLVYGYLFLFCILFIPTKTFFFLPEPPRDVSQGQTSQYLSTHHRAMAVRTGHSMEEGPHRDVIFFSCLTARRMSPSQGTRTSTNPVQ